MSKTDFEEQLRQEKIATADDEEGDVFKTGRTRVDPDGTVFEWDAEKKAWFPKIDEDFIANYQMNYGSDVTVTTSVTTTPVATETSSANQSTASYTDPGHYQGQYSTSGDVTTATTDSKAYREWYNYYYGNHTQGTQPTDLEKPSENATETDDRSDECSSTQSDILPAPADTNSEEYYHWYYKYYGSAESSENSDYWAQYWQYYNEVGEDGNKQPTVELTADAKSKTSVTGDADGNAKTDNDKGKGKGKRKPAEPPSWFDVEEQKNTNVYISGLPPDITDDEFKDLMNKCGLIMFDPITRKPKMKLYKNKDGQNKGDGLCCYIKSESVDLALQFLDGSDVRGHTIYVEKAKFEMKGNFDPSKKRRKLTKHEKKKFQQKQEKLFDWRPDKLLGARDKNERVVILKNAFDIKIFEDPTRINQMRSELKKECSVFGEVKKVVVYDRHPEGVAAITFKDAEMADICIEGMNGRLYASRLVAAATWDGRTKYLVEESEEENRKRLEQWTAFLDDDNPEPKEGSSSKDDPSKKAPGGAGGSGAKQEVPSGVNRAETSESRDRTPGGQNLPQPEGGATETHNRSPGGQNQPQPEGGATEQEMDMQEIIPEGEEPIPEGAAASGGETE